MLQRQTPRLDAVSTKAGHRKLLWLVKLCAIFFLTACDNTTPAEHLENAKRYVVDDDRVSAVIELKNAIQKDRQFAAASALLGKLRLEELSYELAESDLARAVDSGDVSIDTQVALLTARLNLGEYHQVIGSLEGVENLTASQYAVLGQAYLEAGDLDLARSSLLRGLKAKQGLLGMSQLSASEGDYTRAVRYADQALALDPNYTSAMLFKGEMLLASGRADEAVAVFEEAQKQPGAIVIARLAIIRAHLISDNSEKALEMADRLTRSAGDLLQAHYLKGLALFRLERWQEAEDSLAVIERVTREHAPTIHLMAAVKFQLGRMTDAKSRLESYLKLDGSNVSARKLLASVANRQGDYEQVVELLRPISLQQSDPQVWAMLGAALLRLDQHESATGALEKAVGLAPDMAVFRNELALSMYSSGDVDGAIGQLNSAIDMDGDLYQSEYLLAMIKARDGDVSGALAVIGELIQKEPNNPIGHNLLGTIELSMGDLDEAKAAFSQALLKDPDFFPAAQGLMLISQREGKLDEAVELLEQMSKRGNETATLSLVEVKVAQGDFKGAVELAEQATKNFPQSANAWMGFSRLQMALGQNSQAAAAVDRALEISGDTLIGLLLKADIALRRGKDEVASATANRLDQLAASTKFGHEDLSRLANMHLRMNNLTSARRYFVQAKETADQVPADVHFGLAKVEVADKNFAAAQRHLDKLVQEGRASEEVGLLQGDVHIGRGDFEAAKSQFQSMAKAGSRSGATRLVMLMIQQQDHSSALEVADSFIGDNADNTLMKSLRATALVHLGDLTSARDQYESMLPTSDPVVLNNLAWIYMQEDDPKALETAERANRLAPDNADIEDTLGWILVQQGDVEQGLNYLRSSASMRPDNASVQYHLGVAYQKAGQIRRAERALKKAISIGGFDDLEAAQVALSEIESQS